jgi:hypothetical protein
MSPEMREMMAMIEFIIPLLDPEKDKQAADDLKLVQDYVCKLGYAQWQRDTVTDMALKKANPTEEEDFDDSSETNKDSK